jgi:DNA-binding transcriptional ArsR family regulator
MPTTPGGPVTEGIGEVDDELWAAIGDPTRRRVLDLLLAAGPGTASGLSRNLPVTRQAVSKHLAVLERCGLVRPEPAGREVRYTVDPNQFARACAQVDRVSRAWDGRLQRIKAIAEAIERDRAEQPRG